MYRITREDKDREWSVAVHTKSEVWDFLVNLIRGEGDYILDYYVHDTNSEAIKMQGIGYTLLGVADAIERNIILAKRYDSNSITIGKSEGTPVTYSYRKV